MVHYIGAAPAPSVILWGSNSEDRQLVVEELRAAGLRPVEPAPFLQLAQSSAGPKPEQPQAVRAIREAVCSVFFAGDAPSPGESIEVGVLLGLDAPVFMVPDAVSLRQAFTGETSTRAVICNDGLEAARRAVSFVRALRASLARVPARARTSL